MIHKQTDYVCKVSEVLWHFFTLNLMYCTPIQSVSNGLDNSPETSKLYQIFYQKFLVSNGSKYIFW